MVVLNHSGEELNAKIVYYGPGLSGKTTNLDYIYRQMPVRSKGKMVSMKTRTDRTLFFDFLPLELDDLGGYKTRFLLYTVPGQVYYNATRKLVLKGVDGVVFVADSAADKLQENVESLRNLEENLNEHELSLDSLPWVIQYNKRDAPGALAVPELDRHLNLLNVPAFEAVATRGDGVYDTFRAVADVVYANMMRRLGRPTVVTAPAAAPPPGTPDSASSMGNRDAPSGESPVPKKMHEPVLACVPGQTPPPPKQVASIEVGITAPPEEVRVPDNPGAVPPGAPSNNRRPDGEPAGGKRPDAAAPSVTTTDDGETEVPVDVNDVIDSALREVDASAGPTAFPSAESAGVATGDPSVTSPGRPCSVPTEAAARPSRAAGDEPPRRHQGGPAPAAAEGDMGRIIEFDDKPADGQESAGGEAGAHESEFITDPMRQAVPAAVETIDEAPRPAAPAEQELEVAVPIVVTRSQVRKVVPLRLVLQIQIVDD